MIAGGEQRRKRRRRKGNERELYEADYAYDRSLNPHLLSSLCSDFKL